MNSFVNKFKAAIKKIDAPINGPIAVPEKMQVPAGDTYAVYKRSTAGINRKVMMNLVLDEARYWCSVLNHREDVKRNEMLEPPEFLVFFDVVKEYSAEENLYWNPHQIVLEGLN